MELPAVVLALVDEATTLSGDRTQWITGSLWLCGKSCGAANPSPRMMRQALQSRSRLCATHSKVRRQQSQMRLIRIDNLLVKMTSPRAGQKRSAQRIIANAEFYHVAARASAKMGGKTNGVRGPLACVKEKLLAGGDPRNSKAEEPRDAAAPTVSCN
jgi:hypothetical protein